MRLAGFWTAICLLFVTTGRAETPPIPEFHRSAWFGEQTREAWLHGSVRVVMIAPGDFDPKRPTQLIVYATPNGNSIEQTLGSARTDTTDWHFDIQHIAAQIRRSRTLNP